MSSPAKAESPQQSAAQKSASPASQQDQIENMIEAADAEDEDAGYCTDTASTASTSISSSVRDYSFENGRRYHKFREGTYHFPNDEPEQAREDMKHAMLVNVCDGRLHYAPLENPQHILDLGTGTGIWCMDSKFCCSNDIPWLIVEQWATNTLVQQCWASIVRRLLLQNFLLKDVTDSTSSQPHTAYLGPAERQVHGRRLRKFLASWR